MDVQLIPLDGEWVNRLIPIELPQYLIGRAANCHLPIEHSLVSNEHCRITRDGAQVFVEDLNSTFGTSVNGQRIIRAELHDGDRLKVGPTTFMVALADMRASAAKPGPGRPVDDEEEGRHGRGRDPNEDTAAVEAARQIFERLTLARAKADPARPVAASSEGGKIKSRLRVEDAEGVAVVNILDRAIVQDNEIQQIGQEIEELIEGGQSNILLDFGNVKHMSSQAVGVLLQAQKRCRAGGGVLKVCNPNPEVAEIFKITNLPRVIEIHPDGDHALNGPWPEPTARAATAPARPSSPTLKEIAAKLTSHPNARPTAGGEVRLIIEVGKSKGKAIRVPGPSFLIGRDPSCQLRPASEAISRTHTRIDQRDGRVFVRDLGATNGTVLNDRVLRNEEVEAHHGDRLQIGPLAFSFSIKAPAEPSISDNPEDAAASWLLQSPDAPVGDTALLPVVGAAQQQGQQPPSRTGMAFQRLKYQAVGDALLITILSPELRDEEQLGPIRHELLVLLEQPVPKRMVVKMDRVTFLSSSALGMFMAHYQRLDRLGGGMRFAQVRDELMPALEHQNFGLLVQLYPTVEDALRDPWPMT
jgi:anti-anti-sigma factor